ncbi:MAP7 domain-containing protein 2 isoform X2 [Megalops cyprinoides]|uniref:MAP7 domain-containing protein 2 isoform X2 n=1 Tax=Megalops cyprinoides TaxID=118141 RepID=UPI0018646F01|nr:MAP7 domain-containing protein 2 isoform X2 [Megalops cyprinoides]
MEQTAPCPRRRSDGSVRECLFFPVLERNEQERLEALMRRTLERSLQLEHRPKRWTWGGPTAPADDHSENAPPTLTSDLPHDLCAPPPAASQSSNGIEASCPLLPSNHHPIVNAADSLSVAAVTLPLPSDPPVRKRLSSSPGVTELTTDRASPSPHRSPYRSLSRVDHGAAPQGSAKESGGALASPDTTQREISGGARTAVSPVTPTPMRRVESPATPTRSSSPLIQSKPRRVRASNGRAQSPCSVGQYPPSPMRHGATTPGSEGSRKWEGEEKGARDLRRHGSLERKTSKTDTPEKKNSKNDTLERKTSKTDTPEKKMPKSTSRDLSVDRSAEPSPVTPTGKLFAGTTDAEEASRLLAERRRQARLQKELEEKQRREQEEEERLRLEELKRRQEEERVRQEEEAQRAEEARQRQEQERRRCEEEERRQREQRWRELQAQIEREREEAEQRARREAERLRLEREQIKLQEDQERLQRKKRIEEIMRRTRRSDNEVKKEEVRVEPPSPISFLHPLRSPLLGSPGSMQVSGQITWMRPSVSPQAPPAGSPLITLGPLEVRSNGAEEFPDEVQAMDVSPVSKEDLVSIPEFSPVEEVRSNGTSNARALQDLLELTGHAPFPKLSPAAPLGDCNKNLIEGFCSPGTDTQLIQTLTPPPSDGRNVQQPEC